MVALEVPTEDLAVLVLADTITIDPRWAVAGIIDLPSAAVGTVLLIAEAVVDAYYL